MFEKGLECFRFPHKFRHRFEQLCGRKDQVIAVHLRSSVEVLYTRPPCHCPFSLTLKPQQEDKGLIYADNASTQAGQVRSDVEDTVPHKKHPRARAMMAHTIRDPYHSLGYRPSNLRTEMMIPRSVSVCDNKSTRSTDKQYRTNGITRPHEGMSRKVS